MAKVTLLTDVLIKNQRAEGDRLEVWRNHSRVAHLASA